MQSKYFNELNADRTTAASILVKKFNGAGGASRGEVDTKHLTLTWSASNATLRPGQRTALILTVQLKPGMHLYAPGDHEYLAIDWRMPAVEGAEVLDAEYPPAGMKHLPAIDETVPVYENSVRILRDLHTLGGREFPEVLQGRDRLEIEGVFHYQACDARRCYFPAKIPMKWSFDLEPHDHDRVPEEMRRDAGG